MAGIIKFLKVRDVKSPSRANAYDAGIDFYVPEFTPEFVSALQEKNPEIYISDEKIILDSNAKVLITSGIHCQMFDNDRALIAANKSGIASKLGLVFTAQVVDYEYQGEIHLGVINVSNRAVRITPGMKLLQFIETPVFHSEINVTENSSVEEFYEKETTRGAGGFGSTSNI